MPIVAIDIVACEPPQPAATTQALADRLGDIFASKPQGTWVMIRAIPAAHYAENGGADPRHGQPVIARILQRAPPEGEALAEQTRRITACLAELLSRPVANVHVVHEPAARGRVAFGGRLVE